MKPTHLLFIIFFYSVSTFSQPQYIYYTLLKFRLESANDTVTLAHLKNLDVKFYLSNFTKRKYPPTVKYDVSNKEFTFYSTFHSTFYSKDQPILYIFSKKDTVKISMPLHLGLLHSIPNSMSIKPLIKLQSAFYDFGQNRLFTSFFYEFNPSCQYTKDGYPTFYFDLPEKEPVKIDKKPIDFTEITVNTDPFTIQHLF